MLPVGSAPDTVEPVPCRATSCFLALFFDITDIKTCGCFRKPGYPQIIHFNRDFHYKPSILGYPYFWKHPCWNQQEVNGIFPIHQSAFASDDPAFASDDLSKVFCETSLVEISTWAPTPTSQGFLKNQFSTMCHVSKRGKNDICILYISTVVTSKNCTLPWCLSVLQFNFLVTKMSILRISDLVDILWHLRLFAFFSSSGCFSWLFLRHGIMTSTSTLKATHFFPPQKARLLLERLQSAGFPTSIYVIQKHAKAGAL